MFNFLPLGFLYLYFPEDKTEYIPVVIELIILVTICIFVFRWLKKKSRQDAAKAKEIEDRVMQERKEEQEKQPPQN
ncbi:hypothetical protein [Psychrobacillus sp.]|uniref:hypothetical protein n=1 Tax=Psychrobacillus sp. TaxID=1871623 RepID=UPI0028BDF95E|nr:hypothetical protein [Psychrobacillus sp.]